VNVHICWGGNGTCPDSTQSEFTDVFRGKLSMSRFHKKWISNTAWGGNETHWIPEKGELSLARLF